MMYQEELIATVSQVNAYLKRIITQDENLHYLLVKGEISNFKSGQNGHLYFSLKDKISMISVVMFREYTKTLTFKPKDGDEVTILASLDVYEARGTYQLYAKNMELRGQGALLVELEELKKKLAAEGLFDRKKRQINPYPKAIGIISAKGSAALKDILTNIKRRYPLVDLYVFYSAVQGVDAPKELLNAFNKSQEYDLDTLIIGRGGGASEDLSAFNDETLVRAVATSKMPVISAVGHEIDYTLLDYVADVRVSTPTGAAEHATVDIHDIEQSMDHNLELMKDGIVSMIEEIREDFDKVKDNLNQSLSNMIKNYKLMVTAKEKELNALNPQEILKRGYSITYSKDGKIIKNSGDVTKGEEIVTLLGNGKIKSKVEEN